MKIETEMSTEATEVLKVRSALRVQSTPTVLRAWAEPRLWPTGSGFDHEQWAAFIPFFIFYFIDTSRGSQVFHMHTIVGDQAIKCDRTAPSPKQGGTVCTVPFVERVTSLPFIAPHGSLFFVAPCSFTGLNGHLFPFIKTVSS